MQINKLINNINNSEYNIYKIETLEKLTEIKSDWERLFNSNSEMPLLFTFEVFKIYYETIIKNFKKVKIEIYVIKNKNNRIIAIFPFTLEIKKYMSFLTLRELSIKDYFLIGFFNFLIDSEEKPEIIFEIFLKYLKQCKRNWDIIRIYSNSEEYELIKIFKSLAKKQFKIDENEGNTLVIHCNRDFEDYIKNDIDRKDFRELKRKSRRLDEQGLVTLVEMKEPQEVEKGLLHFYDIEDSGWKGVHETSLKRSYYGEFYKKLAMHLSMENRLRLYFLQLNNEYIAGIYAIIDRDIIYLIKIGYLNTFSMYSPSNVLFYLVFKKLFAEKKISKIDFYGPYTHYQKVFGKNTRKRSDINLCNRKIIPTIYYVFARILRRTNYPFKKNSIQGKIFNAIEKQFK